MYKRLSGSSGTSGGAGAIILVKDNVTLSTGSWVQVGSPYIWQYSLTDVDIDFGAIVDFVPYNASVPAVQTAQIYPYVQVLDDTAIFTAPGYATAPASITGQLTIIK